MYLIKCAITGLWSFAAPQQIETKPEPAPQIELSRKAPRRVRRTDMVVTKTPANSPKPPRQRTVKFRLKQLPIDQYIEECDEDEDDNDWWVIGRDIISISKADMNEHDDAKENNEEEEEDSL